MGKTSLRVIRITAPPAHSGNLAVVKNGIAYWSPKDKTTWNIAEFLGALHPTDWAQALPLSQLEYEDAGSPAVVEPAREIQG